jgi:cyanophycinase
VTGSRKRNDARTEITLQLVESEQTRAQWPHPTRLTLTIVVGDKLEVRLAPSNTGDAPVKIGEALHTYFHISDIGAVRVDVMDFDTRRDCQEPARLQRLEEASGIFFTGGNQLRLTTLLGGTPVAKLVRLRNAAGVAVGGTSAGASFLSEHMIAFGDEGSSVISGSVRLAPGLGLTNRFVIDQHFRQRDRLGRLLTALAYNPFAVGIGLDEDTAAFIGPDETVEVAGSGGVTVVDASDVSYSSMDSVTEGEPVCMLGLKLHILVAGATFNMHTRVASPGSLLQPKE